MHTPASLPPLGRILQPLLFLLIFLALTACGDDDRRLSNPPDNNHNNHNQPGDITPEEVCENTCAHVYDTCQLAFNQSDNTPAPRAACVNACLTQNFFRGNESCVQAAACDLDEFIECIRREPEPEPEPEPPALDCTEADEQWSAVWKALEDDVLTEVNRVRALGARCGNETFGPAPSMTMDSQLRCSSRLFSQDMAQRNFFDHTSPEGTTPADRIAAANYTGTYPVGENIAAGYSTAQEVMDGWMKSPGHCKNIMNPDFLELGVGYFHTNQDAARYNHYWTQNFGGGRR